jgi:3',5'-cyclic AMP phosphodiesterase CpdA
VYTYTFHLRYEIFFNLKPVTTLPKHHASISSILKNDLFRPAPLTARQRFLASPILFLATWLYKHQPAIASPTSGSPAIKVVCTSDTHNAQPRLPDGDIFIHAGDLTINGTLPELQTQLDWLHSLPHRHKIVVAGNHDVCLA